MHSSDWEALRAGLAAELDEGISVDALTGDWNILQRDAGHRHSIDDVLTAHYAIRHAPHPRPTRVLDLGTGIGTVGLLVLSQLPPTATLVAIEAQAISYRLLLENIKGNGLGARVEPRHGDLRDLDSTERFALITGSPPYFPVGTGVMPADAQKAHARFELRGDVRDYCRTAARHLAPGGLFAFCFPTPQARRAEAAIAGANLHLRAVQAVIPRAGRTALFSLYACGLEVTPCTIEPAFEVRDAAGRMTESILAVRRGFGHFSVERDPAPA